VRAGLITVVVAAAAITTACGASPVTDQKATTVSAPTPTTTPDVPGADPAAWFEAYCGPMGAVEVARSEIGGKAAQGREAVKDAVVAWASLAAASDRKAADDLEKLGPMGSDVQNPTERLIKSLRLEAKGWDDVSGRLRALAADESFPERYQQVMASRGGNSDSVEVMFKQIAETPRYTEAFRANKVCANWQALARGK
jgi:hypothetical protein